MPTLYWLTHICYCMTNKKSKTLQLKQRCTHSRSDAFYDNHILCFFLFGSMSHLQTIYSLHSDLYDDTKANAGLYTHTFKSTCIILLDRTSLLNKCSLLYFRQNNTVPLTRAIHPTTSLSYSWAAVNQEGGEPLCFLQATEPEGGGHNSGEGGVAGQTPSLSQNTWSEHDYKSVALNTVNRESIDLFYRFRKRFNAMLFESPKYLMAK